MRLILNLAIAVFGLLWIPSAYANTGVFYGAGNQVVPIKNNSVRLVRENVSIRLRVEPGNGKYGISFFPWADVTAIFFLNNESAQTQAFDMGFPFLSLQGFGDEKFVLDNLDFRASFEDEIFEPVLKEGLIDKELDPKGLFKKVFVWPGIFNALDRKKLSVSYRLLVGGNAYRNRISDDESIIGWIYRFNYITKTAYTWKPNIDEAVFSIDSREVLSHLQQTTVLNSFFNERNHKSTPDALVFFDVWPDKYTVTDAVFSWKFQRRVPEDGLELNVFLINVPSSDAELEKLIKLKKSKLKRSEFRKYLKELKNIYGYATKHTLIYPNKNVLHQLLKKVNRYK